MNGGRLRVTVSHDGRLHGLVIAPVQLSDAGQYTVRLTTDHDDRRLAESSTAMLSVMPPTDNSQLRYRSILL